MAMTVFTKVDYTLSALLEYIGMGEIGLPNIQRPFVWPNTKVRDLFDSMYRGFPVGYLLFWSNGTGGIHRQVGTEPKQKIPRLLIVDGQQRLTSLYAVLKGIPVVRNDFSTERVYIAFCPKTQVFEVADAAVRTDPEFISDISELWAKDVTRNKFLRSFLLRLRQHRVVSESDEDQLSDAIDKLYDLQNYPFTALELSSTVGEEQVAEVFVRINSRGTPLNQADFILTLMSVFWDDGRTELETFCRQARIPSQDAPSPFNYFIKPDADQLLRVGVGLGFRRARLQHVYSILRGKDLETGAFSDARREQQFAVLKEAQSYALDLTHWHDFLKAPLLAGFRSENMITSKTALLYSYTLYLVGRRDSQMDEFLLRRCIARWFFMASLTGRYTGSPETVMEQDLARLRDAKDSDGFLEALNHVVNSVLTDDFWGITLVNDLAASSARTPSLMAYHAALDILDARVLFSSMRVRDLSDPAVHSKKASMERHHLFPKEYLKQLGIEERRDVNQIANYALVEWGDNASISRQPPANYYPKYAERFRAEEMEDMCYWHALPDGWKNMDYFEFLQLRRQGMARVIRDGFYCLTHGEKPRANM